MQTFDGLINSIAGPTASSGKDQHQVVVRFPAKTMEGLKNANDVLTRFKLPDKEHVRAEEAIALGDNPRSLQARHGMEVFSYAVVNHSQAFGRQFEFMGHQIAYAFRHTNYDPGFIQARSEERRVGKECRSRWSP